MTTTGAMVTDCVVGKNNQDLTVPGWLAIGAPSLTGVKFLGSAFHQGRAGNTPPPYDSTMDVEISHESELSASRRLILTTDERGGGVLPPGAACATSPADNVIGNGGIHAYRVSKLQSTTPSGAKRRRCREHRLAGVRAQPEWWQGDLPRTHPHTAAGGPLHRARLPPDTGPEPDLHGLVLAGDAGDRFRRAPGRHGRVQGGRLLHPDAGQRVGLGRLQGEAECGRNVHLLGRDRRLQPRHRRAQRDRHLQGDAAGAAQAFGEDSGAGCPSNDDADADGLIDVRELLLFTLLGIPDSDFDGIKDGNDDANGNWHDDEDEDD